MPLEFNEEEIASKPAYEKDIRFISPTGTIHYHCHWKPLSDEGWVEEA